MTGAELAALLDDPATRERVQRALGLPSEPVAAALRELAAAQRRTDASLAALAAEVKELAAELKELAAGQGDLRAGQRELRQAVGALSDNVGFGLEELAAIVLPGVLERDEGVRVDRFVRRYFLAESGEEEVDLFAEAERDGAPLAVVGEVKSRIFPADVKRFAAKVDRIAPGLAVKALPLMFGFVVHPTARDAAAALGVRVVASRPG
jgi:hypothetical protein